MLLINRLGTVTNDSIVQSAGPDVVIGMGRHEDRRNRIPRIDEVSIELESVHRGHMDVGDQAGGFDKTAGCEIMDVRFTSTPAVSFAQIAVIAKRCGERVKSTLSGPSRSAL
jgi:hypothetical protein